jgi:hypothetical protein
MILERVLAMARALPNDTDFVHYVDGRTPDGRWGLPDDLVVYGGLVAAM